MEAGDSFTATPTAMNVTCLPYFACAADIFGSSSLQIGHHCAQNSSRTGPWPTYFARSTWLCERSSIFGAAGVVPTGIPTSSGSCAVATVGTAANRRLTAINACNHFILLPHLPCLNEVVLRHHQHDDRRHPFHPGHPRARARQRSEDP